MEWINGHDLAMVMTAADDGSVKVWRMSHAGTKGMTLVSAWQAFSDMTPPSFRLGGVGFSGMYENYSFINFDQCLVNENIY